MMKSLVNHDMIKLEEVLKVLCDFKSNTKLGAKDMDLICEIERKIRSIETRKRLVVIDGGRT